MNADDIERVRKIVDRDGWNIIWIGAKMPCEFFDEEIELLYERYARYKESRSAL